MTRKEAIELFGTVRDTANALGITVQAVYQWPDTLKQETADRALGAYHRTKTQAAAQ